MDLKERIDKFDKFLSNFEKESGATGLCEAVRSAAKVCFEGLDTNPAWADPGFLDPKYRNNMIASSRDIHRKMFHDIPLAKYKARRAAQKAASISPTDPVGTDAPVEEGAPSPAT